MYCRISVCASIYLIISVGIERYLAVCRPHHYRQVQTQNYRALAYIIPALLVAIIINITKFMEVEPAEMCIDFSECNCGIVVE